jgi:NAD(P)-dependent dehydrogenase (short-subunit alcohol dehydrogenase family)
VSKVYIITGAGHFPGVGADLAEHLLRTGHCVAINSRSFDDRWTMLADQYPKNLAITIGDITDPQIQDMLITSAVNTWGKIDTLVNNASTIKISDVPNREDWNQEFLMNVIVPHELSLKCEVYLKRTQGNIIMIGSRAGLHVSVKQDVPGNLLYSVAKSAMHHLTKSLSVLLSPEIRVNAIASGMMDTARVNIKFGENTLDLQQKYSVSALTRKLVDVNDVVDSIVFLDRNSSITGQILPVCGGASVHK